MDPVARMSRVGPANGSQLQVTTHLRATQQPMRHTLCRKRISFSLWLLFVQRWASPYSIIHNPFAELSKFNLFSLTVNPLLQLGYVLVAGHHVKSLVPFFAVHQSPD